MSKYWAEKVDGQDYIKAEYFNDAFDAVEKDVNTKTSADDVTSQIAEQVKKEYVNLLNPKKISFDGIERAVSFSNLKWGTPYCLNIPYSDVVEIFAITEDGQETIDYFAIENGIRFSFPYFSTEPTIIVRFDVTVNTSKLMLIENDHLPKGFKPYGQERYINDELIVSAYEEIDNLNRNAKSPEVLDILGKEYTIIKLGENYELTIDKDVSFMLPNYAKNGDAILVMVEITESGKVIDWGTTKFFNREIPSADIGAYNFIFEYHNGWYAGAIAKGGVE